MALLLKYGALIHIRIVVIALQVVPYRIKELKKQMKCTTYKLLSSNQSWLKST